MPATHKKRIEDIVHMGILTQRGPQDQSELLKDALDLYLPGMERWLKSQMKKMYG